MEEFIKEKKWDKIYKLIKEDKENRIDLNIMYNNIYLIQYVIIYEKNKLLELLIEKECNIDVLDIDNRTLLHYVIKFNNFKMLNKLLEYNNIYIGVSLLNIKDKDGNTPLHYSIILKNYEMTKEILKYNIDFNIQNNNSYTSFQLSVYQKNIKIIELFFSKNIINHIDINYRINTGETVLHIATNFQNYDICKLLIDNGVDINIKDYEYEYTALNYAVIINNKKMIDLFVKNGANINTQDYYGNSILHYIILENLQEIFLLLIKLDIDVNIYNIDNKIPLHLTLENNLDFYIEYLLEKSNLNFQNNIGDTIVHLLAIDDKYKMYQKILEKKKMDIFIKNKSNLSPYDIVSDKNNFIELATKSFIYLLKNKKDAWKYEWEVICSKKDLSKNDKEKLLKITNNNNCNDIVKKFMLENNISVPIKKKEPLKLILNKKCVNYTTYTGISLDILCGLLYLYSKYDNICKIISPDFIENNNVSKFYNKINFKIDLSTYVNFQILFIHNNIFYPTNFDSAITKCMKSNKRFIIIPLGIEIYEGDHANYIIYDLQKKEVERYEPHGSHNPFNFNYDYTLLDKLLKTKFLSFDKDIKYFRPADFLPKISFQSLDDFEKDKQKKIGDPSGFCGAWSVWYVDMRLNNSTYNRDNLVYKIIKKIKKFNYSFKQIIRNYTINITNYRDKILDDININDYINQNYSDTKLNLINNNIKDVINNLLINNTKQSRIKTTKFRWL